MDRPLEKVLPATGSALLDSVLQAAMDAVVVCDSDQRIVIFSASAEAVFGLQRAGALGMPFTALVPERDRALQEQVLRRLGEVPASLQGDPMQMRGLRADGSEFDLVATVSMAMDAGKFHYTAVLRDVTQQQHERAALFRSSMELRRFASVASHDLRSPIRSLRGLLDILQARLAGVLHAPERDILLRLMQAARHLDELTDDLLHYARLDDLPIQLQDVQLDEVLREAADGLAAEISACGAVVQSSRLPCVRGERRQLVQLMENLLANALKYRSASPPALDVRAFREPAAWVVCVQDNGIGIDERHISRIFDMFERLHTGDQYPGTGIGLAICRRIMDRHGGRIWASSSPGNGSTFFFSMPDGRSVA